MSTRMLVAYSSNATFVQTTLDYLLMLKRYSGFDVDFVHATHDAIMDFEFDSYDVVFNNYCARHCFSGQASSDYRAAMKRYRGLKVLAVQDEYDNTNDIKAAIRDLGFHLVLTCVPQSCIEYVYPRAEFPGVEFMTVFTGYVADSLVERGARAKSLAERTIPIGYRGRDIGGKYGRLAFDKYEIGRRMKIECDARGIKNDIAMDEASRIYGTAWFDFIENCQTMLGTESGSNAFDFDGSLARKFAEMTVSKRGKTPSYEEFAPIIGDRESAISMGQVSPRVFECAALRTPMILFRGNYSGVLEADRHYISLEKDFSNIDDVLIRARDLDQLGAMAERTFLDLIASGRYSYNSMLKDLRTRMETRLATLERAAPAQPHAGGTPSPGKRSLALQALGERPTPIPQTVNEFLRKQRKVSAALAREALFSVHRPRSMARLAASSLFTLRHNLYRSPILRKMIQFIPLSLMYRIKRAILY